MNIDRLRANQPSPLGYSTRALFVINATIEAIILLMVVVSPWPFGAVGADSRFLLLVAISALVVLWVVRLAFSSNLDWKNCPVGFCIAATILLGVFQITPLNKATLATIAPGTASLLRQLLPSEPEQLAQPNSFANIGWDTAGQMISLYPGETRNALVPWLALLLLFLVVRNNPLNPGATKRLCVALLINGTALALFGLLQFFSTPERGKIYWSYQSQGTSFGPFINRNHFAFYMNLCIGPSLGLLLACRTNSTNEADTTWLQKATNAVRELLLSPTALWIGCAIALMLTSVTFCLSRGGFLAMLSGAIACLLVILFVGARSLRLLAVLVSVGIAAALLFWFGLESIELRLGTLWSGEALGDGRVSVMSHSWPLISQFPIFGTGMGTFPFVEPLAIHTTQDVGTLYEHAHNDYLEDLVEGGLLRLILRLSAIVLVFAFVIRAYRTHVGTSSGAIALGLLFAFTSMAVHSFFEFGLYVSAIAVLTAIITAHICNLGETQQTPNAEKTPLVLTSQRIALLAAMVGACLFSWFFWTEGRKAIATRDLENKLVSQEAGLFQITVDKDMQSAIPLIYQMANLNPYNAEHRFAVAETHFFLYNRLVGQKENALAAAGSLRQLEAALQHTIHARNLCPILAEPNTRLAAHSDAFAKADTSRAYISRAKLLAPADAHLWYLCGLQELASGEVDEAWASWKQSLNLSEVGLSRILDRAATTLAPEQILERIMPDRPSILLATAMHFYPDPESLVDRRPYLEKALTLFAADRSESTPKDLLLRATILRLLDRPSDALIDYKASLAADPQQITARLELATLLLELNKPIEARRELGLILGINPSHTEAKQLLIALEKEKESENR